MIKIMQYGEGNFLRSFADLYFETLNQEQGGYEVHVVTPIPGNLTRFAAQKNRYHVILRGVDAGEVVERPYEVNVLKQVIDPFKEPESYYAPAQDPKLKIIVSGYPRDEQTRQRMWKLLDEQAELMSVAEPFDLWLVERKCALEQYMKEGRYNIDVVLTDDVGPYKKRKVRLLNGSHTNLVPAGLMLGAETVYDCMQDKTLSTFVKNTLDEEIIPFVPGSEQFAADAQERFRNPYLDYQLTSIALNSISEWRSCPARLCDSYGDHTGYGAGTGHGEVLPCQCIWRP